MHDGTCKYWSPVCSHETMGEHSWRRGTNGSLFPDISLLLWAKEDLSFAYSVFFSPSPFKMGGVGVLELSL